ncbi:GL13156 [Drosophila persimilis]|uniref:GL13156 n=1 Tax=Drosophila persimilis TaxID=7234 RepID=B4IR69_DROPE|nr:GL13156 [Drosophila persimilis]
MQSDIAAGGPLGTGNPLTTPAGGASASKDRPKFQDKRRAAFILATTTRCSWRLPRESNRGDGPRTVLPDYQSMPKLGQGHSPMLSSEPATLRG